MSALLRAATRARLVSASSSAAASRLALSPPSSRSLAAGRRGAVLRHADSSSSACRLFRRTMSSAAAGSGAGPAGQSAGGTQQEQQQQQQEDEEAYYADEPFAAKASRWLWTGVKYTAGIGIVAVIFYAGYTIVVTLLPGGSSANAIMRRASDVLRADPEIATAFGGLKTYGEDFGSRTEGRRYFVPEHKYTDDWDGAEYHRVKFNLEGDRGQKATVWAEVRAGTHDLRYLIVLAKDKTRVWSVLDGRRPEPTHEERLQRLSSALQDAKWVFYADNDVDARAQEAELGEYWLKVRCVRCDDAPAVCDAAGVASRPAWATHRKGEQLKGVRSVKELEAAAGDLLFGTKGRWWWPF